MNTTINATSQLQLINKGVTIEMGALLVELEQTVKEIGCAVEHFNGLVKYGTYTEVEARYRELYRWWRTKFNRQPLCKSHIGIKNAKQISPLSMAYDKEDYLNALQAAIYAGYAVEVPVPEEASKYLKEKYYMLSSLGQRAEDRV